MLSGRINRLRPTAQENTGKRNCMRHLRKLIKETAINRNPFRHKQNYFLIKIELNMKNKKIKVMKRLKIYTGDVEMSEGKLSGMSPDSIARILMMDEAEIKEDVMVKMDDRMKEKLKGMADLFKPHIEIKELSSIMYLNVYEDIRVKELLDFGKKIGASSKIIGDNSFGYIDKKGLILLSKVTDFKNEAILKQLFLQSEVNYGKSDTDNDFIRVIIGDIRRSERGVCIEEVRAVLFILAVRMDATETFDMCMGIKDILGEACIIPEYCQKPIEYADDNIRATVTADVHVKYDEEDLDFYHRKWKPLNTGNYNFEEE